MTHPYAKDVIALADAELDEIISRAIAKADKRTGGNYSVVGDTLALTETVREACREVERRLSTPAPLSDEVEAIAADHGADEDVFRGSKTICPKSHIQRGVLFRALDAKAAECADAQLHARLYKNDYEVEQQKRLAAEAELRELASKDEGR